MEATATAGSWKPGLAPFTFDNWGHQTMRPTSILAATAASLLLVQAVPAGAETVDLSAIPAGTYRLDKNHASVVWKVDHLGFSNYAGRFNDFDAILTYDPANPGASTLTVTLDPASVDVNLAEFERELTQDPPFFNVSRHPEITFRSTEIDTGTGKVGTVTGDLTMLGVTAPMTFDVTLNGAGKHPFNGKDVMGFSATATINRSDWGFTHLVPAIGDSVEIQVEAEFLRQ